MFIVNTATVTTLANPAPERGATAPKVQAAGTTDKPSCRGRVLVMDDDDLIRMMTCEVLKTVGIETCSAADGAEAMQMYHAAKASGKPLDVIIMDLVVPNGQGGMETIRQLRAIDQQTKAVVSSGYHDASVVVDYQTLGFNIKLAKPYDSNELKATILKLLNLQNFAESIGLVQPARFATAI